MLKMQDNMDDEEGEDLEDSLLNQMKQPQTLNLAQKSAINHNQG